MIKLGNWLVESVERFIESGCVKLRGPH